MMMIHHEVVVGGGGDNKINIKQTCSIVVVAYYTYNIQPIIIYKGVWCFISIITFVATMFVF